MRYVSSGSCLRVIALSWILKGRTGRGIESRYLFVVFHKEGFTCVVA